MICLVFVFYCMLFLDPLSPVSLAKKGMIMYINYVFYIFIFIYAFFCTFMLHLEPYLFVFYPVFRALWSTVYKVLSK